MLKKMPDACTLAPECSVTYCQATPPLFIIRKPSILNNPYPMKKPSEFKMISSTSKLPLRVNNCNNSKTIKLTENIKIDFLNYLQK